MISLEQIQTLNLKVQNALDVIVLLREENTTLRGKLDGYEKRIQELEALVSSFSRDQDDIENGILNILQQLDKLEDDFSVKSDDSSDSIAENQAEPQLGSQEVVEIESVSENTGESEVTVSAETPTDAVSPSEKQPVVSEAVSEPEAASVEIPSEDASTSSEPEFEKSEPEAELDIF